MTNSSKPLSKFFQGKINEHCPTVKLLPFFKGKSKGQEKPAERVPNVYRIHYHLEKQKFLYDSVCNSVYSYTGSSWTGIKRHLEGPAHQKKLAECHNDENDIIVLEEVQSNQTDTVSKRIKPSKEDQKNCGQILIEGLIASEKVAPFTLDQPAFRKTFADAFNALGVDVDINLVLPSRKQTMRIVTNSAQEHRERTISDIKNAISKDPQVKFTLLHDDGTLRNGDRENVRTFSIVWISKDGVINKRYLKSVSAVKKDAASIRKSILEIASEFGIENKYMFLTDAASVNQSVARDLNIALAICGPHTLHNTFKNGLKELEAEEIAFKQFFGDVKKIFEKGSRRHLNHKMVSEPDWIKLKDYGETRWCSMIDCLQALNHNWDLLADPSIALVNNHSRSMIEEFYNMLLPFKYAIVSMEATNISSGHLVALELQRLLVIYINYSVDKSKPILLQKLAKKFILQIENYMDGVSERRITKRICKTRLLQTAFFLPSGYLEAFQVTVDDKEKQASIDLRYERLKSELKEILLTYQNTTPVTEKRSSFGDTALGSEIRQFAMLAAKYHDASEKLPPVLEEFKSNSLAKKDANLLFWNSEYCKQYLPHLRAIIMPIMAISASTSTVEGTFSFANHMRTSIRSRLMTETLDKFLTCLYARLNKHSVDKNQITPVTVTATAPSSVATSDIVHLGNF